MTAETPRPRGRFITLEGGEGAGKSTQIRELGEALRRSAKIPELIVTREPGGAPGAEQIRELLVTGRVDRWDPMTEAILHFAARHDHLVHTVWPALERGDWVLCDRYSDSTVAYQGVGLDVGPRKVRALERATIGDFAPDLTLILDIDPRVGVSRARDRLMLFGQNEDRYERMTLEFHNRLRKGFLDIARRNPDRCVVIDASGSIEAVQKEIRTVVHDRLGVALNAK